jgi:hypothetical protein
MARSVSDIHFEKRYTGDVFESEAEVIAYLQNLDQIRRANYFCCIRKALFIGICLLNQRLSGLAAILIVSLLILLAYLVLPLLVSA